MTIILTLDLIFFIFINFFNFYVFPSIDIALESATGVRKDFQLRRCESIDHKYIGKANDTVSR